jgi:hypothetical protein
MRMKKIKSAVRLRGAVDHNLREKISQNIDVSRSKNNWSDGDTSDDVMAKYHDLLPDKVRTNAVHAIEILMTASPDFKGDWKQYLNDCDDWAKDYFDKYKSPAFSKSNVLQISHHFDETTPHTHILVMPLVSGKLNAKHFIGGHRDRMRELQNDFFEKVGKKHGLDRGLPVEETKARHAHHTLAGKTSELDDREAKLSEREEKLNAAAGEFKKHFGMKPADVQKLKTLVSNWDKANPTALRNIANDIERSGAKTVGEYREARELERQQKKKKKI